MDYFFFLLRPIYHMLGLTTRNQDGVICSEQVYEDLKSNGWEYLFKEVPSPCCLFNGIIDYYVRNGIEYHITLVEGGTGRVIKA